MFGRRGRRNCWRPPSLRSACCPRAPQPTADGPPNRQIAKVTTSPVNAPRVDSSSTTGSESCPELVATAAAAPTTAPVGTTGTIEPSSTPPNSTG